MGGGSWTGRLTNSAQGNLSVNFVEITPWWNPLQDCALPGMGVREALAENMRQRRRAMGVSQEELAHRADLDRTYVSSLERCVYGATIDVVERIAGVLGTEPFELLRPLEGSASDELALPATRRRVGRPIG